MKKVVLCLLALLLFAGWANADPAVLYVQTTPGATVTYGPDDGSGIFDETEADGTGEAVLVVDTDDDWNFTISKAGFASQTVRAYPTPFAVNLYFLELVPLVLPKLPPPILPPPVLPPPLPKLPPPS